MITLPPERKLQHLGFNQQSAESYWLRFLVVVSRLVVLSQPVGRSSLLFSYLLVPRGQVTVRRCLAHSLSLRVAHLIEKWNYFSTFTVNFYILSQVQLLVVFVKYMKYHKMYSLITLAQPLLSQSPTSFQHIALRPSLQSRQFGPN